MKVLHMSWRGPKVMELSDVLTPTYDSDRGIAEDAKGLAQRNSEILGRLTEALVEKNLIDLYEAKTICGIYDAIELVDE